MMGENASATTRRPTAHAEPICPSPSSEPTDLIDHTDDVVSELVRTGPAGGDLRGYGSRGVLRADAAIDDFEVLDPALGRSDVGTKAIALAVGAAALLEGDARGRAQAEARAHVVPLWLLDARLINLAHPDSYAIRATSAEHDDC